MRQLITYEADIIKRLLTYLTESVSIVQDGISTAHRQNSGLGNNVTALEHAERSSSSGATEYAVSDVTSTAGRWQETGIRQDRQCTDIREPIIVAGV